MRRSTWFEKRYASQGVCHNEAVQQTGGQRRQTVAGESSAIPT
jgi:hypothetical protein